MSLFRKVRVLVGALVHKPFMSTTETIELDEGQVEGAEEVRGAGLPLDAKETDLPDQERVADLIAQQQRDGG